MARETGRTRPIPVINKLAPAGKAEEIDAAAAAKAEKSKMEAKKNEDSFNPDWLRLALATGGGLIGHSLASSLFEGKTEEEKRRESLWTKLLSAIIPIGAAGLGAWGGYALGGQLKNAADNKGAQGGKIAPNLPSWLRLGLAPATGGGFIGNSLAASLFNGKTEEEKRNQTMGTEMEIDGRLYGVSPELVPTVHGMGKGWYPGMKSTEMQFMQEKGPRDIDKNEWWEMLGHGGAGILGIGALGTGVLTGRNMWEGLKERRAAEAAMEAQQWADQTLRDANEISKLEGAATEARSIARKAEDRLVNPGKNLNIEKAEGIKNDAWRTYSRKSKQVKPLVKTVSPTQLSTAKAVSEALAKNHVQSLMTPKPIFSRRAKTGIGAGLTAAQIAAAVGSEIMAQEAVTKQDRIRAALEQLAAQTNSAPYAASAPSR